MQYRQFKLNMIAASMAALFAPALYAASAGQVDFVTPGVNVVGPNGQARPLAKGAEVQPGETIDTGTGRAQLRFTDGGYVSLAPQTQFKLESYGYDKDDAKKNGIVMNLLKGGLRSITGLIGKTNREGYKLQTATATVGIRGTEFSITGNPDGSIVFHAADGTISVTNNAGTSEVSGGQSVNVTSSSSPPVKTDEKPFLPPILSVAQTQIPQPQNPVQDSTTVVTPMLVGTYPGGQWRTIAYNGSSPQLFVLGPSTGTYTEQPYGEPTFTMSPSGHLQSYGYTETYTDGCEGGTTTTYTYTTSLGSAGAQSYGNDGVMAWGRWVGGPTSQTGNGEGGGSGSTYPSGQPMHYVVGLPLTNMPTSGVGSYSMYGGTAPSCVGPSCGSISVGSSLSINFGTYEGSYTLAVANSGDGVSLSGGGSLGLSSNGSFGGSGSLSTTTSSAAITGSAASVLNGFLAGPGASHAGAVYGVNYTAMSAAGGTTIYGAAVYKSTGITAAPAQLPP